jgi:putative tryptophan/tyrosine transport system substrate-binding protein
MRRREFIIAGMAAAWPFAAHPQHQRTYRIGVLVPGGAAAASFLNVLREELRKSGYIEGQNLLVEFKSAEGRNERLSALAAELVALKVDVIVAYQTPSAQAAQQATREVPIVISAGDAVGTGLVASLARPGGNITGVSLMISEMHGKCVELFHDMLPSAHRIGALLNGTDASSTLILDQIQQAGKITGIEIVPVASVRSSGEIDAAFAAMKKEGADGVVVQGSLPPEIAAEVSLKHRLPMASAVRAYADVGGLMSYNMSFDEATRTAALFVVKILKGARPADLPVEQPTKFDLVINLKTAKALGINVPATLLARADEVIE